MSEPKPDFAECAAGLSQALKTIAGGFATMGEQHFQEIADQALKDWGYFPPAQPPNWRLREMKLREDFPGAINKCMALVQGTSLEIQADRDRYQARAFAAEREVQELRRKLAKIEETTAAHNTGTEPK